MSQSYSDVVRDALQLLGVISEIDSASAEQGTHGLRILNDMMAHWSEDGLEVEYSPSDSLEQEIDVDRAALRAIKYNLAVELPPHYERQPSAIVVAMAQNSYDTLYRNRFEVPELDMTHLHEGDGQWTRWDIEQGGE